MNMHIIHIDKYLNAHKDSQYTKYSSTTQTIHIWYKKIHNTHIHKISLEDKTRNIRRHSHKNVDIHENTHAQRTYT